MSKFKLVSFSKEVSMKFKFINCIILIPIIFWPLIFFMSVFVFDDPNVPFVISLAIFSLIILYPLYLFIIFEINARLYKKAKIAGYIIPIMIITTLSYFFINENAKSKKFQEELIIKREKRIEDGYIGSCNTYRIKDQVIYYKNYVLSGDHLTFKSLRCHYAKDRSIVYDGKDQISGADAESFEIVNHQWQKDKNKYYLSGIAMDNIDYKTFEILDIGYSKDKNKVYYDVNVVKGANPQTFKVNSWNGICTDGKNLFEYGEMIIK